MSSTVEGIVRKHREGFGFLIQPKGVDDVYISADELVGVMDGDRIEARVFRRRGRLAGRLLQVVERGRRSVIGIFHREGKQAWVEPSDPGLHDPILVRIACESSPEVGEGVKVVFTEWPTGVSPAKGEVVARVGDAADPMNEVLSIAFAHGFSDTFPADVVDECRSFSDRLTAADLAGRRDLRDLPLVTIDGADAKDFDDAVFVERVPGGGYRLVVAIADVVHYVREGGALDRDALSRGTSVYLPGLVLPMLPEELSNGLCSLMPGEDRLCMVADLSLTPEGKTVNTEIYEAVMRSHARLTYDQLADMMRDGNLDVDGSARGAGDGDVKSGKAPTPGRKTPGKRRAAKRIPRAARSWGTEHLPVAVELSRKLNRRRMVRGSIDFDIPEPAVLLDEDNHPIAIEARERLWPHRLVEEFMLAANEAVAFFFHAHGLPTVYRIHEEPDELKLASFATLARAHGFAISAGEDIPSRVINDFLHSLVGRPEQRTLNQLLLRAMQQAIYSSENIGHYGLAAPHYLHFTSPIRRYPDLMVHRLLKAHWKRGGRTLRKVQRGKIEEHLDKVSSQASERERAAVESEREANDLFSALYMSDRIDEHFDASIATVTSFGLFVELKDAHVQGLVKMESLGPGVSFDEERMRMLVPGTGRSWSVGDPMRVVCSDVSIARRQITFEPEAVEGSVAQARPSKRALKTRAGQAGKKKTGKRGGQAKRAPDGTKRGTDKKEEKPARKRRGGTGKKMRASGRRKRK